MFRLLGESLERVHGQLTREAGGGRSSARCRSQIVLRGSGRGAALRSTLWAGCCAGYRTDGAMGSGLLDRDGGEDRHSPRSCVDNLPHRCRGGCLGGCLASLASSRDADEAPTPSPWFDIFVDILGGEFRRTWADGSGRSRSQDRHDGRRRTAADSPPRTPIRRFESFRPSFLISGLRVLALVGRWKVNGAGWFG